MSGDSQIRQFSFRRDFPCVRLFEAAAVSLSPASVAIATLAAFVLSFSSVVIDILFLKSGFRSEAISDAVPEQWVAGFGLVINPLANGTLTQPWSSITHPVELIVSNSWGGNLFFGFLIRLAIALALWSLVGVILCRRSAFLFAGNDDASTLRAINYGLTRWRAALCAPLIPVAAAALLGLIMGASGFVGRLPGLGSVWLTVTSPLVAIGGFVIAFLLVMTALGWPLMVAAVSTDDCDSFGSLSRISSGLTGRPWQAAGYVLVSLFVGTALMSLVNIFAQTTQSCAMWATSLGSGDEQAHHALQNPLTVLIREVVSGVGISFFWASTTMMYLLLRQQIDAVPLDRIALDDEDRPERVPLPVVGIPNATGE